MSKALHVVMVLLMTFLIVSVGCQKSERQTVTTSEGTVAVEKGAGGGSTVTVKSEGGEESVEVAGGGSTVTVKSEGGEESVKVAQTEPAKGEEEEGAGGKVEVSASAGGDETVSVSTGGGGKIAYTTTGKDGKVTSVTETKGGETTTYESSRELEPGDLPVKIFPGAKVVSSNRGAVKEAGKSTAGIHVELAADESVDKVKDFYKKELSGAMEVNTTEKGRNVSVLTQVSMGGGAVTVQIMRGEDGKTKVLISSVSMK